MHIVGWLCLCATEPGDGGACDTLPGSSDSAAPVDGNAAAAPGGDESEDNESGPSSTVAISQQVFLQQQMELAIKSSLNQPLHNCLNDKSMIAAIKSEMAVF
jgi:hypothetical protein